MDNHAVWDVIRPTLQMALAKSPVPMVKLRNPISNVSLLIVLKIVGILDDIAPFAVAIWDLLERLFGLVIYGQGLV